MRQGMKNRDTLIGAYVLDEITIKLSGTLRKFGISGDMRRDVEESVYWPVTYNVRRPKESIEQNVKPVK